MTTNEQEDVIEMRFSKHINDNTIEALFLCVLVGSLLWYVNGNLYAHSINHTLPYSYFASDGFAYLFLTEHVYESGNQKYHPYYATAGFSDVLWQHGLTIYSVSAIFSRTTGLEIYDSLYFIATIFVILNALGVYLILRNYNRKLAMISAGFFAFLFVKNFYVTYLWGQLGAVSGMLFLTAALWSIDKIDLKRSMVLITLFFTSALLTHIPEFIFAGAFIFVYLIIRFFVEKKIHTNHLKKIIIAGIITLVISSYYIVVFQYGVYQTQGSNPLVMSVETASAGLKVASFTDFGWVFVIALILGVLASVYFMWTEKKTIFALLFGMILLLLGFSNYYGFGLRAFHLRAFWPLYIAVLIGFFIYFILKTFIKKLPVIACAIIALVLFGSIVSSYYTPMSGPGAITQNQYDAFTWINKNTQPEDKILLFYGDGYSQSGRLIHRLTWNIDANDYFASLQAGQLRRAYKAELLTLTQGNLMYWKGFMKPGYYALEENFTTYTTEQDTFNYYVFDLASAYVPPAGQANAYVANMFIANNMTVAYKNQAVVVIQNHNLGAPCLTQIPKSNSTNNSLNTSTKP